MNQRIRGTRGFTLIELMMVIVVLGIIAAIALPSYQEQVRRGKRTEGKSALLKAAQMEERFFTTNNTYSDAATFPTLFGLAASATVYSSDGSGPNNNTNSPYTITLQAGATGSLGSSFEVRAVPNGAFTDSKCGTLSITNTGLKSVISGTGSVADCW